MFFARYRVAFQLFWLGKYFKNNKKRWGQIHILEAITYVAPNESHEAELLTERVLPRLQHSNSAIVLTTIRAVLYLVHYIAAEELVNNFYKKLGPPLGRLFRRNLP